jgi:hypothetical protein
VNGVIGEVRQQTPLQQIKVALTSFGMMSHNHRILSWSHVPCRWKIGQLVDGMEQASDCLGRQE